VSLITILLADNQSLTVAGLTYLLNDKKDLTILDQITNREHLTEALAVHKPTLLLIDHALQNYLTAHDLQQVKEISPTTSILVISSDDDKNSILQVLQYGVLGYVTKECSREEITAAVYAVARGEKFYCHKILDIIMEKHFSPASLDVNASVLTVRETEILHYLAKGKSTQQIADELYLSPHTVHTHRKSISKKLGIKSPTEFVVWAMDLGLMKSKSSL
jgi:two-component system, NarL family, invasion response regulator UvrY